MASRPPDAFLSYTRFNDRHDRGAISEFRESLESAVRAVTGEPFEIFQDVDGIGLGEHWPGKLEKILDTARFFIPMMTPSYFKSAACRAELERFLKAEEKIGRRDLILPIYYIQCPVLEDEALREADDLARKINERHREDWRDLRHHTTGTRKVRMAIEALARKIDQARRRVSSLPSTISLEEFKARLPLVEIVARHVRLIRRGREHTGLCPFHQEKTPSFTVSEAKGFYHCFGCGQHGNAIDFIMAIEGLDFGQALSRLADLTGLPTPTRAKGIDNSLRDPKSEISRPVAQSSKRAGPQSFEEVVELFHRHGEPLLHGWLYGGAHLVHFEPGRIDLRLVPGAPPDLAKRTAELLGRWTARPWSIGVIGEPERGAPTLAEAAAATKRQRQDAYGV